MAGESDSSASQRRENFRIELLRKVTVKLGPKEGLDADLVDLSGTGCGLQGHFFRGRVGDRGRVHLAFGDWDLDAPFIVRFAREGDLSTYLGVEFDGLTRTEIERIVREVFAEHRRQLGRVRRGE